MFTENITLPTIFGNVWVKMNRFVMIVQEISELGCVEAGGKGERPGKSGPFAFRGAGLWGA
jgi:hypothetical protein